MMFYDTNLPRVGVAIVAFVFSFRKYQGVKFISNGGVTGTLTGTPQGIAILLGVLLVAG
jgi:hypothetical protein